jgi:putative ABC transport system permease protein
MMKWFNILKERLRALFRRESVLRDIEEELRVHVEMETETNIRRGMPPDEARAAALKSFGNPGRNTERGYDIRGGRWLESLLQDLRYGARMLIKKPGFTLFVVVTLALGIGANTAIFSVVNGVFLSALPYPQPEQLAMIRPASEGLASYPIFADWRDRNQTFQGMAAMNADAFTLTGVGEPEKIRAARVTANFFQLMGVNPARGRGFTTENERPGNHRTVILGHGLWQRRFGGDPGILNRTILLDGAPFVIVGIMAPEFKFPEYADMWMPLVTNGSIRTERGGFWLNLVGRLKPGVTQTAAQADLNLIAKHVADQLGLEDSLFSGSGVTVAPLLEHTVGSLRKNLIILFGAVLLVLLIACANVANILLARAAIRSREVAVRAALGAGRWRIIRQLLTENILLAVLGGALGVLLAWWGLRLLLALSPTDIPRLDNIRLDARVLWFTLALSLLTGLGVGLAPALQATRLELNQALKEGWSGGAWSRRANRIRAVFIVTEVALTLALLVGAGLLVRSFWRLTQVNLGFRADQLLTLQLELPPSKYPGSQAVSFYSRLQERLSALPGVEGVSAASNILLSEAPLSSEFTVENRPPIDESFELPITSVQPNYFKTMGIQLLRGRAFTAQDTRDSPKVGIVNETFVNLYFPNEDPIGKRFRFDLFRFDQPVTAGQWITIVGVVGDTRRQGLDKPIRIESWLPYTQFEEESPLSMEVALRTTGDPLALSHAAREAVWSLDSNLPILKIQTMERILSEKMALRRWNMLLLGLFALVALILAAVGIYGVMNYAVTQRTHEIGVRMALGATSRDVLWLVVRQGLLLAQIGVAIGTGAALALTRILKNLLFGVSATDPATFVGIALMLTSVALIASYIPARRATKVDPLVALRHN